MLDLTEYAWRGYDAPEVDARYMPGSDAYIAWRVGKWLRSNGEVRPGAVASGRGYRVIVDAGRVFEVWEGEDVQDVTG